MMTKVQKGRFCSLLNNCTFFKSRTFEKNPSSVLGNVLLWPPGLNYFPGKLPPIICSIFPVIKSLRWNSLPFYLENHARFTRKFEYTNYIWNVILLHTKYYLQSIKIWKNVKFQVTISEAEEAVSRSPHNTRMMRNVEG